MLKSILLMFDTLMLKKAAFNLHYNLKCSNIVKYYYNYSSEFF